MKPKTAGNIQLGKRGLTKNFIDSLKKIFETHWNVKISLLRSAGHTKENTKQIADKIMKELGQSYTYRIIGFSIFLKRWRKPRS